MIIIDEAWKYPSFEFVLGQWNRFEFKSVAIELYQKSMEILCDVQFKDRTKCFYNS